MRFLSRRARASARCRAAVAASLAGWAPARAGWRGRRARCVHRPRRGDRGVAHAARDGRASPSSSASRSKAANAPSRRRSSPRSASRAARRSSRSISTAAKARLEAVPWVQDRLESSAVLPDTLFVRLTERAAAGLSGSATASSTLDRPRRQVDRRPTSSATIRACHHAGRRRRARQRRAAARDAGERAGACRRMSRPRSASAGGAGTSQLDNGIDVALPEDDADGAWHRLAALDRSDRLLERRVIAGRSAPARPRRAAPAAGANAEAGAKQGSQQGEPDMMTRASRAARLVARRRYRHHQSVLLHRASSRQTSRASSASAIRSRAACATA